MHARAAIAAIVLWIVVPGAALAGDDAADFRREGKGLEGVVTLKHSVTELRMTVRSGSRALTR